MQKKSTNEPHDKRRGRLKNGNPPGNPYTAPRCGARTREGTRCQCPAMRNGRCRLHGGLSTGPRTVAGLARSKRANWKHGEYSEVAKQKAREFRQLVQDCKALIQTEGEEKH